MQRVQRRVLVTVGVAMVLLIPLGWWAFRPIESDAAEMNSIDRMSADASSPAAASDVHFDAGVFDVTLWHRPPAPSEPVEAAPPPIVQPALRVELLGISAERERLTAWIFDPDKDEIRSVHEGDELGPFVIRQVTRRSVTLHDGSRSHELVLIEPPATPRSP